MSEQQGPPDPMPEQQGPRPIPTVADVVTRHVPENAPAPWAEPVTVDLNALVADLIAREDQIGDFLRVAGSQLAVYPELVAKVLADAGLGTPVDADTKALLDQQFVDRVNWLNEMFRRQQGGG